MNSRIILIISFTIIIIMLIVAFYLTFKTGPKVVKENKDAIVTIQRSINTHTDSLLSEIRSLYIIQNQMQDLILQLEKKENISNKKLDSIYTVNQILNEKVNGLSDSLYSINQSGTERGKELEERYSN